MERENDGTSYVNIVFKTFMKFVCSSSKAPQSLAGKQKHAHASTRKMTALEPACVDLFVYFHLIVIPIAKTTKKTDDEFQYIHYIVLSRHLKLEPAILEASALCCAPFGKFDGE